MGKVVLIDPFTNIPYAEIPTAEDKEESGSIFLSDLRELQVGQGGTNIFRADKQGIWLGAETFATAPFSVTMAGVTTLSAVIITGGTIRYGKTSFSDDTHAGYYMGSEGLYFGSVGDTTKLKYDISLASFDFIGAHSGGTVGGIAVANVANVANGSADIVPTGLTVSSTGVSVGNDGSISAYIILTWTAISSDTFDHYLIRYKKGSFTYYAYVEAKTNTITIEGLTPNIAYNFGIASVNKYGIASAFSTDVNQTTAADAVAPATVTAGSATAGIQYVIVEWTHNTDSDLDYYNIYRNTVNDSGTATLIGKTKTNYFIDGGRTGGTEYFYWVKAVDTSGNVSASFSTVKSATPRNVETTDVTAIAATKILIDGVVYLSNWRKTGDLTKIDGGNISTNTVTLSQLNFTPVQDINVIASINASAEGIVITGENIEISGSTTFASGYNPTTKVAAVGGSYASAASGARVLIFPDANTGIQVIDDATNDAFKVVVGGTNVGDVVIGNYAGGEGVFYDKSLGKTTFAGAVSGVYGTFGVITAGELQGLTIKTATSGKRIEILSSNNSLTLYDVNGNDILDFGSQTSVIQRIIPYSDVQALLIQNSTGFAFTNRLVELDVQGGSSSGDTVYLSNAGSGRGVYIAATGSGKAVEINKSGTNATVVEITNTVNGITVYINKSGTGGGNVIEITNAGTGYTVYLSQTNSANANSLFFGTNAGTGRTVEIQQTNVANANSAFYFSNAGTGFVIELANSYTTSTHFKKMINLGGVGIYISDGTTPNGNLSGNAGDVCLGADGGKSYYCTGTTNWTAF